MAKSISKGFIFKANSDNDRNSGNNMDEVDTILDGVQSRIRTTNKNIVVADQKRNKENLSVQAEQHRETLEALGDIESGLSKGLGASSFIAGAAAPSLIKTVGASLGSLISPLLLLGKLLGKGSAIGIALSGVAFLGKVLIDSLSDSQIALIKSTVDNITSFASEILGDSFEVIASGLNRARSFVSGSIMPAIGFLKDAFGPAINEFFSLGETVFNIVISSGKKLGEILSVFSESLVPIFESVSDSIASSLEIIGPIVKESIPKIGTFFKEFFLGSILVFGDVLETTFSTLNDILIKIVDTVSGISSFFSESISGISDLFGINNDGVTAAQTSEPTIFGFVKDVAARTFDINTDRIDVNPSLPTSTDLEAGIAQAQISNAIILSTERQEKAQEKQAKETIKILTKTEEKRKGPTKTGRRSLDNSPIMSDDVGLIYTLGGG